MSFQFSLTKAGAVLTEIKSSLTVLKVPWHYINDVILKTDEKQPLNQGPFVGIPPVAKVLVGPRNRKDSTVKAIKGTYQTQQ